MERDEMIHDFILDELLVYFAKGSYHGKPNKALQADFKDFTTQHRKLYREVLDGILEQITDYELETWRTFKLDWRRLKICKVCNEPYYNLDKFNKGTTCYKRTYTRHNKQGEAMKMSGKSECYMENRRNITRKYRQKQTQKDGN